MAIIGFLLCSAIALFWGGVLAIVWTLGLMFSAWRWVQDCLWRREYAKQVSHYHAFMRRCEL
ncbi:hypothetical protein D3C87_1662560 [compost metagenome]